MAGGGEEHAAHSSAQDDAKDSESDGDAAEEVCRLSLNYILFICRKIQIMILNYRFWKSLPVNDGPKGGSKSNRGMCLALMSLTWPWTMKPVSLGYNTSHIISNLIDFQEMKSCGMKFSSPNEKISERKRFVLC